MIGNNIAADYSTRQFLREYQFAMHRWSLLVPPACLAVDSR